MSEDKSRRQPRYGSGHVLLVDGPLDGERISGFFLRGRLECEGGVYQHVLGGEPMALFWIEEPIIVAGSRPEWNRQTTVWR